MKNTAISWTNDTINLWAGCTKVSDACKFCYAAEDTARKGFVEWGPKATRRVVKSAWDNALSSERAASKLESRLGLGRARAATGVRQLVVGFLRGPTRGRGGAHALLRGDPHRRLRRRPQQKRRPGPRRHHLAPRRGPAPPAPALPTRRARRHEARRPRRFRRRHSFPDRNGSPTNLAIAHCGDVLARSGVFHGEMMG